MLVDAYLLLQISIAQSEKRLVGDRDAMLQEDSSSSEDEKKIATPASKQTRSTVIGLFSEQPTPSKPSDQEATPLKLVTTFFACY